MQFPTCEADDVTATAALERRGAAHGIHRGAAPQAKRILLHLPARPLSEKSAAVLDKILGNGLLLQLAAEVCGFAFKLLQGGLQRLDAVVTVLELIAKKREALAKDR